MLKITVESGDIYRRVEAKGFDGFNAVYLIEMGKPARDIENDIYVQYHEYLDLEKNKRQARTTQFHPYGCVRVGTLGEIPKGRHTGESPEARKNYFESRDYE